MEDIMNKNIIITSDAFIVRRSKVLLIRHEKSGLWLVPGGKRELHETLQQAVVRETREETGLDIALWDGKDPGKRLSTEYAQELISPKGSFLIETPFGETHHDFCFFATVSDDSKEGQGEYEQSDLKWCSVWDLEQMDLQIDIKTFAVHAIDELGE